MYFGYCLIRTEFRDPGERSNSWGPYGPPGIPRTVIALRQPQRQVAGRFRSAEKAPEAISCSRFTSNTRSGAMIAFRAAVALRKLGGGNPPPSFASHTTSADYSGIGAVGLILRIFSMMRCLSEESLVAISLARSLRTFCFRCLLRLSSFMRSIAIGHLPIPESRLCA